MPCIIYPSIYINLYVYVYRHTRKTEEMDGSGKPESLAAQQRRTMRRTMRKDFKNEEKVNEKKNKQ